MKGQWIGRTTGDQVGQIIVNIDATDDGFSGAAFTLPDDPQLPPSVSHFVTNDRNPDFSFPAATVPINPTTGLPGRWEQIQTYFPDITTHATRSQISGRYEETNLFLRAETTASTCLIASTLTPCVLAGRVALSPVVMRREHRWPPRRNGRR